jgi:hypothetical protein
MDPRLRYLWKYFIVHSNKLTILLHVPLNQSWESEHQMVPLLPIIVNFLETIMCVSIELFKWGWVAFLSHFTLYMLKGVCVHSCHVLFVSAIN